LPAEIAQLGVLLFLQLGDHRLQRHAALGAGAGADLADLRVHRAGVLGGRVGLDRRRRGLGAGIALRLGDEAVQAALAAEVVVAPAMAGMQRAVAGHRHAAHRVLFGRGFG